MITAPFIASTCASAADGPAPVHGAFVQDPGALVLRADLGLAGALPTALVGGTLGVAPGVDLGAHADTHAGLAVGYGATARWRLAPERPLAVGLTVDHSFFTVEELGGIESVRVPFGNRLAVTPALLGAWTGPDGVAIGWSAAAELGVVRRTATPDGEPVTGLDPALDHLWGEVVASWPRRHGSFFVRFRAIVPVAREFHVLGYLPWVAVGRTWGIG